MHLDRTIKVQAYLDNIVGDEDDVDLDDMIAGIKKLAKDRVDVGKDRDRQIEQKNFFKKM